MKQKIMFRAHNNEKSTKMRRLVPNEAPWSREEVEI